MEAAKSLSELIRFEILNRIIDIDIIIDSKSGCWLPKGVNEKIPDRNIYQRANIKFVNKRLNLHVLSAIIFLGFNFDRQVLHKCDIKACFNPEHLYLGTAQDNSKDYRVREILKIEKGTILNRVQLIDTTIERLAEELIDLELEE